LDGLGPVSGKLHSTEEYFHLNTFFSRQLALVDLLKRLELEQRSLQDEHSKLASGFSMAGSLA